MDVESFLNQVRNSEGYAGQIVHVHEVAPREARYGEPKEPLPKSINRMLAERGIEHLYSHQAEAIDCAREGKNVLMVTGTASGKSLGYVVPILEMLINDPEAKALLLFPTKALCQDQYKSFNAALNSAGLTHLLAGVYDGDTPSTTRRKLRDHGSVIFSNPDMLHSAVMPQHARWAGYLERLRILVIDELHILSGIFGSNMVNLLRRFFRVCGHYGSYPQIIACSATIGNPKELAEGLTDKPFVLIDDDGSPRGKRTFIFWNPPRTRARTWRGRRSANVEAHELMARLIELGVPTITFSKAKMTAEMIHRYVCESLEKTAPHLKTRVTPYRGGYLPEERREIERRLFNGELLGVSTTPALELGIDVGGLDASILVGYPGTLASFFQQSGRAGRRDRDALVVLVGLDTSINQYVMSHPEYIFGRAIEQAVLDPDNPFVILGHLRCAAHEIPITESEAKLFGAHAETVLAILEENHKIRRIEGRWYHAASETPQHEVSMRDTADANVVIEDGDTGSVIGEINRYDAPPILHPDAIYMHQGDTYRVTKLDLEKNVATVKRVEVDYYTQPLGGTDIHHVDHQLREKPFGTGRAYWGEVTAYFQTWMYEKIRFYELDALSRHGLDLPKMLLETMAFWIVPPEDLMEEVRRSGLDAHSGLRGIGYATRMILPLFMTCDTLDFSHTVGSVNSPWNSVFIYERYPHGLGFTEKAYELLDEILPTVLENIKACPCREGCPCCVGKPLRQSTTWNVERGEASIPSKEAALMILEGLLSSTGILPVTGTSVPEGTLVSTRGTDSSTGILPVSRTPLPDGTLKLRLERALRRRLERMREPAVFHPIEPKIKTEYPEIEKEEELKKPDVAKRAESKRSFQKELRKRIAKKVPSDKIPPTKGKPPIPEGMKTSISNLPPTYFPGRPERTERSEPATSNEPLRQGDSLAAKAWRIRKNRSE